MRRVELAASSSDARQRGERWRGSQLPHPALSSQPQNGGVVYARDNSDSPVITGVDFINNRADGSGSVLYLQNQPSEQRTSISDASFTGNDGVTIQTINSPIDWDCRLGSWMPRQGAFEGDFSAPECNLCSAGYYGNTIGLTDSSCEGACHKGYFCPAGTAEPLPCAPGFYMPVTGAASAESCLPCSPGTSQSTAGAVQSCDPCPPGTFADQLNATGCTDCPAGSFCPSAGTVQPLDCAAGEYQNLTGQAACVQCPAGEFQPERGQTSCDLCAAGGYCEKSEDCGGGFKPCLAGSYNEKTGSSSPDACQQCPPGTFSPTSGANSSDTCKSCRSGTFAAGSRNAECEPCKAGSYQNATGAAGCVRCGLGSFCPVGASLELPAACESGTYANFTDGDGFPDCFDCPAGSSCGGGATLPAECSPGTVAATGGLSECASCEPGWYQPFSGGSKCVVCGAGSYSINVLSCELCQVGEYCPAGSVVGTPCPPGSTTDGRGATRKEDCGCYAGLYDASGSLDCLECSEGMNCTAAITTPQNLPVAAGYWRQHSWSAPPNGSVRPCFTEEACLGGTNLSDDAFCAPSQQGPYCAVCRDGYFGGGDGTLCKPCDGLAAITFLPMVLIGVVALALLAYVVISCYRGMDILNNLAEESSKLAEAVAAELQTSNAATTFTSVEAVAGAAMATRRNPSTIVRTRIARARWLAVKSSAFGVKLKILIAQLQMQQGIGITFYIQWPDVDTPKCFGSLDQLSRLT